MYISIFSRGFCGPEKGRLSSFGKLVPKHFNLHIRTEYGIGVSTPMQRP